MTTITKNNLLIPLASFVAGSITSIVLYHLVTYGRNTKESDDKIQIKHNDIELKDTTEKEELLHWDENKERRGLGNLLHKVNHIAITVSDVGESLAFYSDILGFQQIRRPNFDRHGAWLTIGNIELHLIKGVPTVHHGNDLVVGHISVESTDISAVLKRLDEMKVHYKQNISVPDPKKSRASVFESFDDKNNQTAVVQYFLTDPDGYYIELCNCDILTKFCFNKEEIHHHVDHPIHGYEESVKKTHHQLNVLMKNTAFRSAIGSIAWRNAAKKHADQYRKVFGTIVATEVNETIYNNLLARRKTYGDVTQGYTDEEIKEILLLSNNDARVAVTKLADIRGCHHILVPPPYYEDGVLFNPDNIHLDSLPPHH